MEDKFNIKATKGFWTPERDRKLVELVRTYGGKLSWPQLAKAFPGIRGKYIRERYRNHLDPELKNFAWTWDEDQILKKCYIKFGNKWEIISRYLPGRTANQVKNRTKRREFRELFPQPPNKKKAWDPTVYPSQRFAKNSKRLSILEQSKAIALKQEENHRLAREELKQEKEKQLIVQPPIPRDFLEKIHDSRKSNRERMTKTKKIELTSMHLHRTFEMIKSQLTKRNPSDFYLIFQTNTKREIFTKIKAIQWTITQLWPLVTNRSNRQSHGQETAFFLYCLIKADNALANKILHRLLKCGDEDYLMRKVEKIIEDIDEFIRTELQIVRQQEMMERNNLSTDLKAELQESFNTDDTGPKQENSKQKQEPFGELQLEELDEDGPLAAREEKQSKSNVKMEVNPNLQLKDISQRNPPDIFFQYDLDFAMLGKLLTIGNQITNPRPVNTVKAQQRPTRSPIPAKIEVDYLSDQEQAQSSKSKQPQIANTVELSSASNLQMQSGSHQHSDDVVEIVIDSNDQQWSEGCSNDESLSQQAQIPMPECVQFQRVDFIIELTEQPPRQNREQQGYETIMPFYEWDQSSEASSSGLGSWSRADAEQKYTQMSDSNEVLMRVKYENIEDSNIECKAQKKQTFPAQNPTFQQILRNKIMNRLQNGQSKQAVLDVN